MKNPVAAIVAGVLVAIVVLWPAQAMSQTAAQRVTTICAPGKDKHYGESAYKGGLSKAATGETPITIANGTTISSAEAHCMVRNFGPEITVLSGGGGSYTWLPMASDFAWAGVGDDTVDIKTRFETELAKLTGGNKQRPILTYCKNSKCFLAYNIALRAAKAGYKNVYWFRDGMDSWGWQRPDADAPLMPIEPVKLNDDPSPIPAEPNKIDPKCYSYPYKEVQTHIRTDWPRDNQLAPIKSSPLIVWSGASYKMLATRTTGLALQQTPDFTIRLSSRQDVPLSRQLANFKFEKAVLNMPRFGDMYLDGFSFYLTTEASKIDSYNVQTDFYVDGKLVLKGEQGDTQTYYEDDGQRFQMMVEPSFLLSKGNEGQMDAIAKWASGAGGTLKIVVRSGSIEVASAEFPSSLYKPALPVIRKSWVTAMAAYRAGRCKIDLPSY